MIFTKECHTPGEHVLSLTGDAGQLEAVLLVPEERDTRYVALLGHPHSLQGGTMNNKVVTTLARTLKELRIASLRFNFRGVGLSEGCYDEGLGESEDMLLLARCWHKEFPTTQFVFAGFSFGSYVAYRAAAQYPHALLLTIAPPVHHYDYMEFYPPPSPWIVVQGDRDEVVPLQCVLDFTAKMGPAISLLRLSQAGHFFHGALGELKAGLLAMISAEGYIV